MILSQWTKQPILTYTKYLNDAFKGNRNSQKISYTINSPIPITNRNFNTGEIQKGSATNLNLYNQIWLAFIK